MPPAGEPAHVKSVDIVVCDLRASKWDSVPPSQRKQTNVTLQGVRISGPKTFENLRLQIQQAMKISINSPYVISRPNQDAVIDSNSMSSLMNDDFLILIDSKDQKLPFVTQQVVNTMPHTNTLTEQDGTYHGNQHQNAAAFALAEFLDNSLSATYHNTDGNRNIEIRFYDSGPNSTLVILDNGCGMNSEMLKDGLVFKAPKDFRRALRRNFAGDDDDMNLTCSITNHDYIDQVEDLHPMYLNSNISKFGAGMKQAIFYLGSDMRIMTKTSQSQNVSEVVYSKQELEKKEGTSENPWETKVYIDVPGKPRVQRSEDKIIKDLIAEEVGKPSFTHIVITNIIRSRLDLLRKKDVTLELQLGNIYHYYIHGRDCYNGPPDSGLRPPGLVDIVVTRLSQSGDKCDRVNLRSLQGPNENLEHKFVRTAKDTFNFSIDMRDWEYKKGATSKAFRVGGIIRYHPCEFDEETHPEGLVIRKKPPSSANGEGNLTEERTTGLLAIGDGTTRSNKRVSSNTQELDRDDESSREVPTSNGSSAHTGPKSTCEEFFSLWWNGRLIPNSKWPSFDWCSPSSNIRTNDPLRKCYDRISGSLFFDSNVDSVTDTKLAITLWDQQKDMFKEKRIGGQSATFNHIVKVNGELKTNRMQRGAGTNTASKSFETWLRDCHKKYDKQAKYSKLLETKVSVKVDDGPTKTYDIFEKAVWEITRKVGDLVKLRSGKGSRDGRIIGKVEGFLVEAAGDNVEVLSENAISAPLAHVKIQQLPEALFGPEDGLIYRCMTSIDTSISKKQVQEIFEDRENELEMTLELKEWVSGTPLENGTEVPIGTQLANKLKMDVVRTSDRKSVAGVLFHPTPSPNRKGKKISLVARVYKLCPTGKQELQWTSALCEYLPMPHGAYFFKNIVDLTKDSLADLNEPGNYVVTFHSYVDISEEHRPAPTSRRSVAANGVAVVPALPSTEEDPDSDNIGRHTLRSGKKKIRMPHESIFFKVVPGPPVSMRIESIGNEDNSEVQLGEPFSVKLSLWDSKGNVAVMSQLGESIIPKEKPLLTITGIVVRKVVQECQLSLNIPDSAFRLEDNFVVIPNVVLNGPLNCLDRQSMKCQLTAHLQFKKLLSSSERIHVKLGKPHKLQVSGEPIEVENGTRPAICCRVLDSSGNTLKVTPFPYKPILLLCDIFNGLNPRSGKNLENQGLLAADHENDIKSMDGKIDLDELKNGENESAQILCKIKYDQDVQLETDITLTVVPSKKPNRLQLFYMNGSRLTEITPDYHMLRRVTQHVDSLTYGVTDGMGNRVNFDTARHKFKFEWPTKVRRADIENTKFDFGNLPIMEIPNQTRERRQLITRFQCDNPDNPEDQVVLTHSFFLTSTPLEPTQLAAKGINHREGETIELRVDEALSEDIILSLQDEHGNVITELQEEFTILDIQADTPDHNLTFDTLSPVDLIEASVDGGTFGIRNLRVVPPPPIGKREVEFSVGPSLKTLLKIRMVPGLPAGLEFEVDNKRQKSNPVVVIPNMSMKKVRVHVVDSCRNLVPNLHQCFISLEKHPKMVAEFLADRVRVNSMGTADFKSFRIGMREAEQPGTCKVKKEPCRNGICFNTVVLAAKAEFGGNSNAVERCNMHITCRPNFPTNVIVSNGSLEQYCYQAGSDFSELTATLESEDGRTIMDATTQNLTMTLSSLSSTNFIFPISPSRVHDGVFSFGGVPGKAGRYSVKFTYQNDTTNFQQQLDEELRIIANSVSCIEPGGSANDGTVLVTVSNDPNDRIRRSVTTDLKLRLKDEHKNFVAENLTDDELRGMAQQINGHVRISLATTKSNLVFEDEDFLSAHIPIKNGVAEIPNIVLQPQTNLKNNSGHSIVFTAKLLDESTYTYKLEFIFFNDISQQQERKKLEDRKIAIGSDLKSKSAARDRLYHGLNELEAIVQRSKSVEDRHRQILGFRESTQTENDFIYLENSLQAKQRRIEENRDDQSNVPKHAWSEQELIHVVGEIGHLAEIRADKDVQRVLSWHLQRYLPVIVVRDKASGHALERKYKSQKEFMLADIIHGPSVNWNWDEQFPPRLQRIGNAVGARHFLDFTLAGNEDIEICKKVFKKILGRTVIVDTMRDAIEFKSVYQQNSTFQCPPLLTRDGKRLTADAIIGGNHNVAPALASLRYKFGLAMSNEYTKNSEALHNLAVLKSSVLARVKVQRNLQKYKDTHLLTVKELEGAIEDLQAEEKDVLKKLKVLNDAMQAQNQILCAPPPVIQGCVVALPRAPNYATVTVSTTPPPSSPIRKTPSPSSSGSPGTAAATGARSSARIRRINPEFQPNPDESPAKRGRI